MPTTPTAPIKVCGVMVDVGRTAGVGMVLVDSEGSVAPTPGVSMIAHANFVDLTPYDHPTKVVSIADGWTFKIVSPSDDDGPTGTLAPSKAVFGLARCAPYASQATNEGAQPSMHGFGSIALPGPTSVATDTARRLEDATSPENLTSGADLD